MLKTRNNYDNVNTSKGNLFFFYLCRVLGTPTNAEWEGVEELPDYKTAFPKWKPKNLKDLLPEMEPAGIDLLQVMGLVRSECIYQISIYFNKA